MPRAADSVRQPIPWVRLAGVVLVLAMTLVGAAANMIPFRVPTKRELQRADQLVVSEARRTRIVGALVARSCNIDIARDLARDLVLEGLSAAPYADDYAERCFDDEVVRRWGNASLTLRLPRVPLAAVPVVAGR